MNQTASTEAIWARLNSWNANKTTNSIYVLVDTRRAREESDPIALPQLVDTLDSQAICVPRADLKHQPNICPYLVRIGSPNQPLRRQEDIVRLLSDDLAGPVSVHGHYVAAFLTSSASPTVIAQSLARRLVQRDRQGRQRVTALFEPLRLALYFDDVDDQTRIDAWLASLDAWMTVNGGGCLLEWRRDQDSPAAARLPYTPADAYGQARIPEIRRLLVAMRKADIAAPRRPETSIADCLAEADIHGLTDPEDRTLYVLNSLSLGTAWAATSAVHACIRQAARNEQRLATALECLPEQHQRAMTGTGDAAMVSKERVFV